MTDTPAAPTVETRAIPYSDHAFRGVQVTSAESLSGAARIADVPTGLPEGSVLATATTRQGEPTTKPDANSVVTVRGVAMRLSAAVENGFVIQDADGNFKDVSPAEYAAKAEVAQQAAEAAAAAQRPNLDAQSMSDFNDIQRGLAELGLDFTTVLAESLGTGNWNALSKLAASWDVPAAEVETKTQRILDALEADMYNRHLAPRGVDLNSFYEWLVVSVPKQQRNSALIKLAVGGSYSGYEQLIHNYQNSKAYTASAKVPAGATTRVDEKGQTIVKVDGYPEMTLGAAHVLRIK